MRPPVFWAHVKMMPRIQAERDLATRTLLLSAGGRQLDDATSRRVIRDLEVQKDGGKRRVVKATLPMLAQMRIKVKQVPATAAA